jgi:hypothetical protein
VPPSGSPSRRSRWRPDSQPTKGDRQCSTTPPWLPTARARRRGRGGPQPDPQLRLRRTPSSRPFAACRSRSRPVSSPRSWARAAPASPR